MDLKMYIKAGSDMTDYDLAWCGKYATRCEDTMNGFNKYKGDVGYGKTFVMFHLLYQLGIWR